MSILPVRSTIAPARSPLSHTTRGKGEDGIRRSGLRPPSAPVLTFAEHPTRITKWMGLAVYRTTSGAFLVFRRDFGHGAIATDQPLLSVS